MYNISSLHDKTQLQTLNLSHSSISNISCLSKDTNLVKLILNNNCINDIYPIKDLKNTLNTCITILENSSPQVIFNRGYSMVQIKATKKIVRSAQDVKAGDEIQITPASGTITATVNNTNK